MMLIEGEVYRFKTLEEMEKEFGKDNWRTISPFWDPYMDDFLGKEFVLSLGDFGGKYFSLTNNYRTWCFDICWVVDSMKWVDVKPPLKGL